VDVVRPSPQADSLFRLRHSAGVARDLAVAQNPQAKEPPMPLSSPNRSIGLYPRTDERKSND